MTDEARLLREALTAYRRGHDAGVTVPRCLCASCETADRWLSPDPIPAPEIEDHHEAAWATTSPVDYPCVHSAEREGCKGCAHDAALRTAAPSDEDMQRLLQAAHDEGVNWQKRHERLTAAPEVEAACPCIVDAASPGPCPYCHHREHGSTGCSAAIRTAAPSVDAKTRRDAAESMRADMRGEYEG